MSDDNGRQLPAGWARAKLGHIVEMKYGKGLPKAKRVDGEIPVYGSNGPVGRHCSAITKAPCLVVGRKGSAGAVHLSRSPCWPIDTTYFIDDLNDIVPAYLFYTLRSMNLGRLETSTAIPGLNRDHAYEEEVILPPTAEQHRIVEKIEELFSDLDAGVAALERVRRNLKRYRASVLKAAVEGKLTEAWRAEHPDVEPASELLARILKERRRRWEEAQIDKWAIQGKTAPHRQWKSRYDEPSSRDDGGLTVLPKGWAWTNLDALTFFTVDYRGKTPPTAKCGVPIISAANVKAGSIVINKPRFVSEKTYQAWTVRGLPRSGDLIITTEAPVAEVALYPTDQAYLLTRRVFACQTNGVDNRFLVYHFMSNAALPYLRKHIRGSTVPRILKPALLGTPVPLAPIDEQEQIVGEVERQLSVINSLERIVSESFRRVPRLRQSILKQAFEGKLVPQDPNDEPASVLLDRIRKQREEAARSSSRAKKPRGRRTGRNKTRMGELR